jgi:hypothetical protein
LNQDKGAPYGTGLSVKDLASRSVRAILSGRHGEESINGLISVCTTLAIPYLSSRLSRDVILKKVLQLDVRDFAYDCIADLFAYAGSGEFPHLEAYFAAYPPERLNDEELLSHLRRLVFSHVNHGIFRLYNEVDPSLGKILRNIKLALQQFQSLKITERFGEPCLAPAEEDSLVQLRPIEMDELESGLRKYLHGNENIPFMLGRLSLILLERSDLSRVVPLSLVGMVFRSIYTSPVENADRVESVDEAMEIDTLAGIVRESVKKVHGRMATNYAAKKRIDASLLETYFKVIERRLVQTFSGDGQEKGLREILKEHIVGMTDNEYRTRHRSRLEYLSRLTGAEVARRLKHD